MLYAESKETKGEYAMNIQQMQYYAEVCRQENVTKAAAILHMSQSTLSLAMKNIEEDTGLNLLCAAPVLGAAIGCAHVEMWKFFFHSGVAVSIYLPKYFQPCMAPVTTAILWSNRFISVTFL